MGSLAYVTTMGSKTVVAIDTATNTVVNSVPVDGAPIGIALTPDGTRAYITTRRRHDGAVSVLDTASHTVTAVLPLTDFFISRITITPDGTRAYVANSGNDHVINVLDTATNTVAAQIPFELSIDSAVSPDGKWLYVSNFDGVTVIDTTTNSVTATIAIGKGATSSVGRGIAVSPDGATLYLTDGALDTVSVIDTATQSGTATIPVGDHPVAVAVGHNGTRTYVTNLGGTVSVIDNATNSVTTTINVGAEPAGVKVTADGSRLLVANSGGTSKTVSVIDIASETVVADIVVGARPWAIAVGR